MSLAAKTFTPNMFFHWGNPVFPVDWIFDHPRVAEIVAKMVWIFIPIEYYVLTRFPGGFKPDDYIPAAAMAVGYVLAIFAASCTIGGVKRLRGERFERTLRLWSMSLMLTWGGTLLLLALSYAIGARFNQNDIVGECACSVFRCTQSYPSLAWPTVLATAVTYLVYSTLVVILFAVAAWAHRQRTIGNASSAGSSSLPHALNVAVANAMLMTILHGLTTI